MALSDRDAQILRQQLQGDRPGRRGVVIKKPKEKTRRTSGQVCPAKSASSDAVPEVGKEAAIPRGDRD